MFICVGYLKSCSSLCMDFPLRGDFVILLLYILLWIVFAVTMWDMGRAYVGSAWILSTASDQELRNLTTMREWRFVIDNEHVVSEALNAALLTEMHLVEKLESQMEDFQLIGTVVSIIIPLILVLLMLRPTFKYVQCCLFLVWFSLHCLLW